MFSYIFGAGLCVSGKIHRYMLYFRLKGPLKHLCVKIKFNFVVVRLSSAYFRTV